MASPLVLPQVGYTSCKFDPLRPRDVERMEGRFTEAQTFGTPFWKATYKTGWLRYDQYGLMDAFMMTAGDDGETFIAYDAFRPRPIKYDQYVPLSGTKASGGAFNGDAVLRSIIDSRNIVVDGLPAAFQLSVGDYVEVRKSPTVRSLHRITAAATSNGSGVVTLSIKYGLDTGIFTLPCTVHFEKPSCLMQIDPGSVSAPKSWEDRGFSFSATEVFFG